MGRQEIERITREKASFAIVWNPSDARVTLARHRTQKADKYGVLPYTRKSCFAVVVYQNMEHAKAAMKKFNENVRCTAENKVKPILLQDELIELMTPSWRSWCNRFSDSNMEDAREGEGTAVELTKVAQEESKQKKV